MARQLLSKWMPAEKIRGQNLSGPTFYASGTIWPHGEWSLGYGKVDPEQGDWHENPLEVSARAEERICDGSAGQFLPLNLSDATNSHSRPKRGLKGMTGYGQQMIKACGHLMQEKWPRHRKTLGTITLPAMSQQARAEVVALWPELTRQLLQWLSRKLERQGLPPVVCSVTEIQPARLQSTGQGCLHWHLLWLNIPAKAGNWAVDPCDVRTWLSNLLCAKIPSYQGGHVNVNTKKVEGKVAAYMAKYMSKGKQMIDEAVQDWGEDNCPRTWWNMTKPARDMVKAATHRGREPGQLLECILEHALSTDTELHYAFLAPIKIDLNGVLCLMGWRGRFTDEVSKRVRNELKSADISRFVSKA